MIARPALRVVESIGPPHKGHERETDHDKDPPRAREPSCPHALALWERIYECQVDSENLCGWLPGANSPSPGDQTGLTRPAHDASAPGVALPRPTLQSCWALELACEVKKPRF